MNRRNFLKDTSLAGLTIASIGTASFGIFNEKKSWRDKPVSRIIGNDFALNEITIDELQQKMNTGEFTSRSVTELYLKRISEIDKDGPRLNSIIELNPDALSIADKMDEERKAGKIRGAMHGIPVLVKDNINTGDRMMTTAGSLAMLGHRASEDAFVVKKLREAGAVLLGKTNCSEWSNFRSSRSASGWSSRGGQTKNPCMLDRSPSGSSSGSAVAVAANLCVVAIGTETDGSIVAPSSYNGLVGIKPTVGLISRSGIIPISKTQDTAGPMARTVRDAAILLNAIAGIDNEDPVTTESVGKTQRDYTAFLNPTDLRGKRIGIERTFLDGHEGVVSLYKNAIEVLKKRGAAIIEVNLMKPYYDIGYAEFTVFLYEFKDGLNRYLSKTNANVKSLADVIAFNKKNESTAMPYFKQETLESSQSKGNINSKEYIDALKKRIRVRNLIDDLMKEKRLDAISATSIGLPCTIDLVNGDYNTGFYFCPPAAVAGYPHITVPMGKVHELPVGLSFTGRAYSEPALLQIAFAFEQASLKREPPKFLPTAQA